MPPPSPPVDPYGLIDQLVDEFGADLVALRRDLHAHPEIGNEEFRTTALVVQTLEQAGLAPEVLKLGTGVVCDILPADVEAGPVGELVALRADLDALPITDGKDVAYRSRVDGKAHACGHDVHTTVLVGTGLVLARLRSAGALTRGVRLIFQPAEESSPGGAVETIACGVLDGVAEAYALHCDPRTDAGQIALKVGPITSAVDQVIVTLTGPGGHTSRPHLSADIVAALGAVATTTQLALSRRVDPRSGVSMMWGRVAAGTVANAVPQRGVIEGTLRALDASGWRQAQDLVPSLVAEIVAPFGVGVEVAITSGVPPTVNTAPGVAALRRAGEQMLGPAGVTATDQSLGGEDFAWMLQQVPGALARLGVRTPGQASVPDIHTSTFDVDETCIGVGVRVLAALAATDPPASGFRPGDESRAAIL